MINKCYIKRKFKKYNILDIIFIFVLFLLILTFCIKFAKNIHREEENLINIEMEVVMIDDEFFSKVIKEGDQLIERNIELDAYLKAIQKTNVLLVDYNDFINNSNLDKSTLIKEKTKITIKALVSKHNDCYKLGNQEIIVGQKFTLESMLYKYNTQIIKIKELDS